MAGTGELDSQAAARYPLSFGSSFEFQQDYKEMNGEDAGPSTFTSDQLTAFQPEGAAHTLVDFPLDPALFSGQTIHPGDGFVNPSYLESGFTPVHQQFSTYAYPAPAQSLDQPAQPYYVPAPPTFEPPQTPYIPPGPNYQAQLAEYYAQAAGYYKVRADLWKNDIALLDGFAIGAGFPHGIGSHSQASLIPTRRGTLEEASSGTICQRWQDSSSEQSSSKKPVHKETNASETPVGVATARIVKETLTGAGIQRFSSTNPKHLNARTKQILEFDPKKVYTRLSAPPQSWGNTFSYTLDAELLPGSLFTVEELHHYLFKHPLHTDANGLLDSKNSGLRLWIQRNPSDSKRRYGQPASSRCRLTACCAEYNLIGQAQYRVTFDERHKDQDYDPMHNAGYVHLYCLEKFFDFPRICATLNVRAEDRTLRKEPGGRNRMLFSSDEELELAQQFIEACEKNDVPHIYPRFDDPNRRHEGSLVHMLAIKKVENESQRIRKARVERGARASFEKHLGNLEVETAERHKSRRPASATKRKHQSDDEEEQEETDVGAPSKKRSKRTAKPTRGSSDLFCSEDSDSDEDVQGDVGMEGFGGDDEYKPRATRSGRTSGRSAR